jgi:hypothetical protein
MTLRSPHPLRTPASLSACHSPSRTPCVSQRVLLLHHCPSSPPSWPAAHSGGSRGARLRRPTTARPAHPAPLSTPPGSGRSRAACPTRPAARSPGRSRPGGTRRGARGWGAPRHASSRRLCPRSRGPRCQRMSTKLSLCRLCMTRQLRPHRATSPCSTQVMRLVFYCAVIALKSPGCGSLGRRQGALAHGMCMLSFNRRSLIALIFGSLGLGSHDP